MDPIRGGTACCDPQGRTQGLPAPGAGENTPDLTILSSPVGNWDATGLEEVSVDCPSPWENCNNREAEVSRGSSRVDMERHTPGHGERHASCPCFLFIVENGVLGILGS